MNTLKRQDWLLLVLFKAEGEPLTPVQLQKTLFLLGENAKKFLKDDFYTFVPYNYGPFSARVYSDAESLQSEGLLSISAPSGQRWKNYALTQKGTERAKQLAEKIDSPIRDYLTKLVQWMLDLDFNTLIRWIYSKYPAYRANSVFQG